MQTSKGVLVSQPMAKDVKIDAFSLTSYGEVRVCVCVCVCERCTHESLFYFPSSSSSF
jgi:hypothetical protein